MSHTRSGGVCSGPHASFNLGLRADDDPQFVAQNRILLQQHLPLAAVVQGEGLANVGPKKGAGKNLAWGAHDCFFVPSWNWHHFENKSKTEPAIIFSVTDRPVLESLGLFRDEAA
jgi:gentisate 1,2-dioxygenase